jgi:hypothetical protein
VGPLQGLASDLGIRADRSDGDCVVVRPPDSLAAALAQIGRPAVRRRITPGGYGRRYGTGVASAGGIA